MGSARGVPILRYAAFGAAPGGGNPAGVVLDASSLTDADMQCIAADVGYSETAFAVRTADGRYRVRYFAPEAEVDFCGHATIATGVALAEHVAPGDFRFVTNRGTVAVQAYETDGCFEAAFESVPAAVRDLSADHLAAVLAALRWPAEARDARFPPLVANAGNDHPVVVASSLEWLEALDYDFDALRALCVEQSWITVQLVAAISQTRWRSRNPFPYGGVVEDPATGSAAAAFGAYLRALGRVTPGDVIEIEQGIEMGCPSCLRVTVRDATVLVAGPAVRID